MNLFCASLFITLMSLSACDQFQNPIKTELLPSGLFVQYQEIPELCERKSKQGDVITIHYTGTMSNARKPFYSTYDRHDPFKFELGTGKVIQGVDDGLLGMCVGEKRTLTIPPHLGFGNEGWENVIPAGATLIFNVKMLYIEKNVTNHNDFKEIDLDNNNELSLLELTKYLRVKFTEMESVESTFTIEEIEDMQREENINHMAQEMFSYEDADHDGKISWREFYGGKYD